MSDVDGLLAEALEFPTTTGPRMVLADWLEEQGDATNAARAALLRLQVEWETGDPEDRPELNSRLKELFAEHPTLAEIFLPLLHERVAVLSLNPALVMVLASGVVAVDDGPIQAGSVWRGHLMQSPQAFPTTLTITSRQGNLIVGEMSQDFASVFGPAIAGQFYFRGVVVGRSRLMFVTYRANEYAAWPGLYQLDLKPGGWLSGTWSLPQEHWFGELQLRRRRGE